MAQQSAALTEGGWRESDTSFASYGLVPSPSRRPDLRSLLGRVGRGGKKTQSFLSGTVSEGGGRETVRDAFSSRQRPEVSKERRSSGAVLTGRGSSLGSRAKGEALGSSLSPGGRRVRRAVKGMEDLRPGPFPAGRGSPEMDTLEPLSEKRFLDRSTTFIYLEAEWELR